MIEAIGGQINASAAMNVLLNELAGTQRARRKNPSAETYSTEAATEVRGKSELTEKERHEVEKLKRRDQEVRRHEFAHQAAGTEAKARAELAREKKEVVEQNSDGDEPVAGSSGSAVLDSNRNGLLAANASSDSSPAKLVPPGRFIDLTV